MAGDENRIRRSRSGRWLPGVASPNPGGRPKADPALRELIGRDGSWVWAKLKEIVEASLADGDRVNAIRALSIMASKALPVVEGGAAEVASIGDPESAARAREKIMRLIEARADELAERRALVSGLAPGALPDPALLKS